MRTPYQAELTPAVGPDDHVRGDVNAPVTLVEYGDFQCPYCGAAYPMLKELEREAGKMLRVVFRNFPLSTIHQYAEGAAEAAEAAAAQGKFWEMHDDLFENQDDLSLPQLAACADAVGLDAERFRSEMKAGQYRAKVRAHFHSGVMSGVNGTPTFFINGVRYDGDYTLEGLLAAVKGAAKRR